MATSLQERLKFSGGYVDNVMGPYESLSNVMSIALTDRFEGLTVTVLSPVQMDCWLLGGTLNSKWRVKELAPVDTFAALEDACAAIAEVFKAIIGKGTVATVLNDETNGGKVTKYQATNNVSGVITWEKLGGEGGNYVPLDCISGKDLE